MRPVSRREWPGLKVCKHCGQEKPVEEFHRRGRGTRNSRCRVCIAARRRMQREALLSRPRPADWPTCGCGCGEPVPVARVTDTSKGIVRGQPLRFVKGHTARTAMNPTRQSGHTLTEDGCWEPVGRPTTSAYRQRRIDGEKMPAHRAAYIEANGTIPDDHHVHHTCENKHCVNPDHLEVLTAAEHTRLHHKGTKFVNGRYVRGSGQVMGGQNK